MTELLVVIVIITMLATLTLVGLSAVRKQTRIDQTKQTIQKIHVLLMNKLAEYETKRVKVTPTKNRTIAAEERAKAIYDMMRMDMPDRISDLQINDPPVFYDELTSSARSYKRRIETALGKMIDKEELNDDDCANMSAELLYMIIMRIPNAAEQFAEFEIGDTNNNGLKEFVDGWGNPIRFLRWAPGINPNDSNLQKHDQHSPFDPYSGSALSNYTLYPFIFSAGPDKKPGVNVENEHVFQGDPYNCDAGKPLSDDYDDNITNHNMDYGNMPE